MYNARTVYTFSEPTTVYSLCTVHSTSTNKLCIESNMYISDSTIFALRRYTTFSSNNTRNKYCGCGDVCCGLLAHITIIFFRQIGHVLILVNRGQVKNVGPSPLLSSFSYILKYPNQIFSFVCGTSCAKNTQFNVRFTLEFCQAIILMMGMALIAAHQFCFHGNTYQSVEKKNVEKSTQMSEMFNACSLAIFSLTKVSASPQQFLFPEFALKIKNL